MELMVTNDYIESFYEAIKNGDVSTMASMIYFGIDYDSIMKEFLEDNSK